MNTKTMWTIIVIIALVIAGYFAFRGSSVESPDTTPETTEEPTAQTTTVMYTDEGFSPNPVAINVGDTVEFVNNSSSGMWVASAVHPTHEELPGFDQNESVGEGGTYRFTFTEAGTWNYHNHANPEDTGSVVVATD
jgi:plastocyanin